MQLSMFLPLDGKKIFASKIDLWSQSFYNYENIK